MSEMWRYPDIAPYDVCAPAPVISAKRILSEVAEKHRVPVAKLKGARRFKQFVKARQEAYYRLVKETHLSFPQIGRLLGNRDHSTIFHGIRKYASDHGLKLDYANRHASHRRKSQLSTLISTPTGSEWMAIANTSTLPHPQDMRRTGTEV